MNPNVSEVTKDSNVDIIIVSDRNLDASNAFSISPKEEFDSFQVKKEEMKRVSKANFSTSNELVKGNSLDFFTSLFF